MRRAAAVALAVAALGAVAPPATAFVCPYTANAVWHPVFGENLCYA